LSGIEAGFLQHRRIDLARGEIGGNKMKSLAVDIRCHFRFDSLRRRMIDFPKASGAKFPVKRQGEGIKARAENDDLGDSVLKRFAREQGEAFLPECIMPQDSGDGAFFDELHYPEEPTQASQSKKQSRCP
jgi:hypothetical protein